MMQQDIKVSNKRYLTKGGQKYSKVSYRDKILLLKRVIIDHHEIKQTAEELNINYSTAKTIMRKFKRQRQAINHKVLQEISNWYDNYQYHKQRCQYKIVSVKKRNEYNQSTEYYNPFDYNQKMNVQIKPITIYQQILYQS